MSSPEVAEPKVFPVRMVLKLAPVGWGSSRLSPGVGRDLEPVTVDEEGRFREGGNWLRRTLTGSGLEEVALELREELRGGLDGISNE